MWKPWACVKPISAQTRASSGVSMPSATVLTRISRGGLRLGRTARRVFGDGQMMLKKVLANRWLTANAVVAFYPAASVDGDADNAPRQRTLVHRLGGDIGGMRAAVPHGNPEALGRADGDVSAELAGGSEDRERQRVRRHYRERARGVQVGVSWSFTTGRARKNTATLAENSLVRCLCEKGTK